MTFDNFSPIQDRRYIDVGAGGPTPFAFTVSSNATWLKVSNPRGPRGSISPNTPEERAFISVPKWNILNECENSAIVTFTAAVLGQPSLIVPVIFITTKNSPPNGFSTVTCV